MHNAVLSSRGDTFCTVRRKLRQSRVKGKKGCFELFVSSTLTLSNAIARVFVFFCKTKVELHQTKTEICLFSPFKAKITLHPTQIISGLFNFWLKVSARLVFPNPWVSEKQEKKPWIYLRMFPWNHSWQPADIKPELWPRIGCTQSSFGDLRSQHLQQWVFEITRCHGLATSRMNIFVFAVRVIRSNWCMQQETKLKYLAGKVWSVKGAGSRGSLQIQ